MPLSNRGVFSTRHTWLGNLRLKECRHFPMCKNLPSNAHSSRPLTMHRVGRNFETHAPKNGFEHVGYCPSSNTTYSLSQDLRPCATRKSQNRTPLALWHMSGTRYGSSRRHMCHRGLYFKRFSMRGSSVSQNAGFDLAWGIYFCEIRQPIDLRRIGMSLFMVYLNLL